jgi:hypothetical protein
MHWFFKFIFGTKLYVFQAVPLSIIRSFSLYTQQWYMSTGLLTTCEQDQDGTSWSCLQAVSRPVWHTTLLCVQWKTPDDGQRNCLKHVEFHSKNKFEKLVYLVGFIIRNISISIHFGLLKRDTPSLKTSGILDICYPVEIMNW